MGGPIETPHGTGIVWSLYVTFIISLLFPHSSTYLSPLRDSVQGLVTCGMVTHMGGRRDREEKESLRSPKSIRDPYILGSGDEYKRFLSFVSTYILFSLPIPTNQPSAPHKKIPKVGPSLRVG